MTGENRMKKSVCFLFALLLAAVLTTAVYGAGEPTVGADATELTPGAKTSVEVRLENNPGLMGFSINVQYPTDKIEVVSVEMGGLLSVGNFLTDFGVHDGSFDVKWYHTGNIDADGVLFVLEVKPVRQSAAEGAIKLSYSQDDTFNEKMEDVVLKCEDIGFKTVSTSGTTAAPAGSTAAAGTAAPKSDATQAVSHAGTDVIIAETETFTQSAGERYFADVLNELSGPEIRSAINDALIEYGVTSIDDVSEDRADAFVEKVDENIRALMPSSDVIPESVSGEEALETVRRLYNFSKPIFEAADEEESLTLPDDKKTEEAGSSLKWIWGVTAALVIGAALAVVIMIRRKKTDK